MLLFPVKAGNTNKVRVWISPLDCLLSVCKFVCLSGGWNKNYQPDFHEKLHMDKMKNWFSFVVHLDHFLFHSLKTGKCCIGLGRRWARCPFSYFIYTSAFPMWKCVGGEKHGALRHKRQTHSQTVGAAVHCRRKYSHSKCVNNWYWRFGKILQELQWLGKIGRFWAVDKGEIKELQSFLTTLF